MKTNHKITFLAISFCLLLSSCVTVSYFGDKMPPTSNVDIYYSAHDVKRDYKVIGHLTCNNLSQTAVKEKLIAYGQKISADAVVISGTDATKDSQAAYITADALVYSK
jgi:hypothetical protein